MATVVNSQQRQGVAQVLAEAQAALNGGQVRAAQALCQRVLAAVPGEPHTLHMLGLIAYDAGTAWARWPICARPANRRMRRPRPSAT